MADPDLRTTTYMGLVFPTADLDPWDAKYVEQMDTLDLLLMHMEQKSTLIIPKDLNYFDVSWVDPALTITQCKILVPRYGGILDLTGGPFTIPSGNYLSLNCPDAPWTGTVNPSVGISPTPGGAGSSVPLFYNDGTTLLCLVPQG